jgi:hypothetical protein
MIAHAAAAAHAGKHTASALATASGKTAPAAKSAHGATDFSSVLAKVTGNATHAHSIPKKA